MLCLLDIGVDEPDGPVQESGADLEREMRGCELFYHEGELQEAMTLPLSTVAVHGHAWVVRPDGVILENGPLECLAGEWGYRPQRTFWPDAPKVILLVMTVPPGWSEP